MKSPDVNDVKRAEGRVDFHAPEENERVEPASGVAKVAGRVDASDIAKVAADVPSEVALLAALLWTGQNAPDLSPLKAVREILPRPDDFFTAGHRLIYGEVLALADQGMQADPVAVHTALAAKNATRAVGGLQGLEDLVAAATPVSEAKARAYALSIADAALRRSADRILSEALRAARTTKGPAPDAIAEAQRKVADLAKLTGAARKEQLVSLRDALKRVFDRLRRGEKPDVLKTGFAALERGMGGLYRKQVTVVAARTSVGKSALTMQIVRAAVADQPSLVALYVSLEMGAELFAERLIASVAEIDATRIRLASLSASDFSRMATACESLMRSQVFFVDSQQQTMASIRALCAKLDRDLAEQGKRLAIVAIDHIGLVRPGAHALRWSREQQVAEVSRELRFIADEHDCHVIGIAQINREAAKQTGKDAMPKLHQLRDSGALEQDTDNVLILHRERDGNGMFLPKPAKLAIAKQRSGALDVFDLAVEPRFVRFGDIVAEGTERYA